MGTDVVILGCGPAGLLAAEAAALVGADVRIYSRKVKSVLGGAQYLHQYIPNVTNPTPDAIIEVRKVGTPEGYARKVYGDPEAPTSWADYDGLMPSWNLRGAYDLLWERWHEHISDCEMDAYLIEDLWASSDMVISSIPLPVLAALWWESEGVPYEEVLKLFEFQDVWIEGKLRLGLAPHVILYNGDPDFTWYRASRLFGTGSTEYPVDMPNTTRVRKPLRHSFDEDIWGIVRVGRYGKWSKGVLAHHAYTEVLELLHAV